MKPLPPELDAKIDEVTTWLFDGDQIEIAKGSKKSRARVCKALNKHAFNARIMEVAIQVMNEDKARLEINTNANTPCLIEARVVVVGNHYSFSGLTQKFRITPRRTWGDFFKK